MVTSAQLSPETIGMFETVEEIPHKNSTPQEPTTKNDEAKKKKKTQRKRKLSEISPNDGTPQKRAPPPPPTEETANADDRNFIVKNSLKSKVKEAGCSISSRDMEGIIEIMNGIIEKVIDQGIENVKKRNDKGTPKINRDDIEAIMRRIVE